jgi:putative tricarboxylic transport membrane protein
VIASMVIGNLVLLILNIPLVGVFVQLLRVRMGILAALIVVVTMIGVYSVNNNVSDIWIMLVFGALGYVMRKTGFEPGPLALAFVLGPILEQSFRQSVLISGGSPDIFFTRPISGALFGIALLIIVFSIFQFIRKTYRSVQRQD